ncbi:MAG: hypothetical protein L0H79_12185 [Intrasporangium sp.]|uniref:hypothetical protein n=1 Tax=Intrasporangium sp. TaxID=1925024 RepID=UPI0026473AEB|nr:hypothetical protein [Intrasporangium sp.]MDN5796497.1 hypothetical protein [Intrasporangium sp.]
MGHPRSGRSALGTGAPLLKAYVQQVPGARPHVPVHRHEPVSKFEAIATAYPVFLVTDR